MADPFSLEVGERIRKLRIAAGLTQQQLADAICMSRVSVTNLEVGRQNMPIDRLGHIANALGVAPGALVGEVDVDDLLASVTAAVTAEWSRRYAEAAESAAVQLRMAVVAVTKLRSMIETGSTPVDARAHEEASDRHV